MSQSAHKHVIGLDFGTTNTIVSTLGVHGHADLQKFTFENKKFAEFRSAMTFWREVDNQSSTLNIAAGPWAVGEFSKFPEDSRYLQSFKTFAASESFQHTMIYGEQFRFEDLLQNFYDTMISHTGAQHHPAKSRLVIGRPVRFAGHSPNEAIAVKRYGKAFGDHGYSEIVTVLEPVAAAFYYARKLQRDTTVLVGDFGGGTSDFSIIHFEFLDGKMTFRGLATSGVPVAGDALDYRIIDNVVSPRLGKDTKYVSFGSELDMPSKYYGMLARWSDRFLLRSSKTLRDLNELRRMSRAPAEIEKLIKVIENDSGIELHRSVGALKNALSQHDQATFSFQCAGVNIETQVTRTDFETWIETELNRMRGGIQAVLDAANLESEGIDQVFLTGGTSLVPAVRRLFSDDFGFSSIDSGDELISISAGLALIGGHETFDDWVADTL